jgi:predicted DsbA family dithiol-disulfide isomerase
VRTDRLQQDYGVKYRFTVFPLHPDTPEEGMELSQLFAGHESYIDAMQAKLMQVAATEGLPLTKRTRTYNSRLAQELGKWAETKGLGGQFHREVYRNFFVDGSNIARVEVLVKIAETAGLPTDEARKVLEARSYAHVVEADWQRSRELRITAVPAYLFDGKKLVGFGSYDDFVHLIGKG